jgi:hypothetical protein
MMDNRHLKNTIVSGLLAAMLVCACAPREAKCKRQVFALERSNQIPLWQLQSLLSQFYITRDGAYVPRYPNAYVAKHLAATENKEQNVLATTTINELLALNEYSLGDCEVDEILRRRHKCYLIAAGGVGFVEQHLATYCHHVTDEVQKWCNDKMEASAAKQITSHERGALQSFHDQIKSYIDTGVDDQHAIQAAVVNAKDKDMLKAACSKVVKLFGVLYGQFIGKEKLKRMLNWNLPTLTNDYYSCTVVQSLTKWW